MSFQKEKRKELLVNSNLPPASADHTLRWTQEHARAWTLVEAWERAASHWLPRYRLWDFYASKAGGGRRPRDPRTVHVFKQVFLRLDASAQASGATAEELIAAYWQTFGPKAGYARRLRPNWMLNVERSKRVLAGWREYLGGRTPNTNQATVVRQQVIAQAVSPLADKAKASIVYGYTRLADAVWRGRVRVEVEPFWTTLEPWVEGVTVLGPDDRYRDDMLVKTWRDGKGFYHVDDDDVQKTFAVRNHRRQWWDLALGVLIVDGHLFSKEFLWGIGRVLVLPSPVVAEAQAADVVAESIVGPGIDPVRQWGASVLREWHREAKHAAYDPIVKQYERYRQSTTPSLVL